MRNVCNESPWNPNPVRLQGFHVRWFVVLGLVVCLVWIQPIAHAVSLNDSKAYWLGWSPIKIPDSGFDFGGKMCAPDNRHYTLEIDLEKYSDNKLGYIKVGLQTLGTDDAWRTIGTSKSEYVKVYSYLCEDRTDCLHSAATKID
ncbi:hypothetical protein [uncultured Nitrospira sp.]|uniref:hypothetical protein n=1 Tax=uncultured Nitrospira sp. TaxID=157176 RepID=UPI0031406E6B